MAFVSDPNAENKDQPGVVNTVGDTQSTGGIAGAPTGSAPQSVVPGKATSSGRFTDLRKYMAANKAGTAQAAGQIAGGIQTQVGEANKAIGSAQEQSTADIGKAVEASQGLQKTAGEVLTGYTGKPAGGDATAFESTLKAGLADTGADIGKMGLGNEKSLIGQAQGVEETGRMTGTQEGRGQLLAQQAKNRPTYSAGMKGLDVGLISGSQAAKQQLAQAGAQAGGVRSGLETAKGAIGALATKGAGDVSAGQTKLLSDIGTGATSELTNLTKAAEAMNTQTQASAADITEDEAAQALKTSYGEKLKKTAYDPTTGKSSYSLEVSPGVLVPVADLVRSGYFTGTQSSTANTGNIDPQRLAMLNVMQRLSQQAETAGTGAKYEGGTSTTANQSLADKQAGLRAELEKRAGEFGLAENNLATTPREMLQHVVTNRDAFIKGATTQNSMDFRGGNDSSNAISMANKSTVQKLLGPNAKDITNMSPVQIKEEMLRTSGGDMGHVSEMMKIIAAEAVQKAARQQQYNTKQDLTRQYFDTSKLV